jgi:hypothetical protein
MLFAAPAHGDEVAIFLEELGLRELLAVHLEERLELGNLKEAERDRLVVQLADLYAGLLETVEATDRRESLEQRSRRLLAAAPENSADQLRLALIGGSYRSAERTAENYRLRLASDTEVDAARETLTDVVRTLQQFRQRMDGRVQAVQRRLSRSAGGLSVLLTEELEQLEELRARATFLAAWALYYQSFLHARPDNARVAEELFAELLGLESAHERPELVSEDRRGFEAYARSILGLALCKSLTSQTSTALAWIELLKHPATFDPVRRQATAWEIVILLEHEEYVQVRRLLDDLASSRTELPLSWLRAVAVHALEAAAFDRHAGELARVAVTRLAAQKELSQVLDLAERYGTDALGESGFALRYVSGVLSYHEARDLHGDEQPTLQPDLGRIYQRASTEFEASLGQADVRLYPDAASDARRLLAWCLYFRGEFLAARDAFLVAEAEASTEDAPDLLWMAIVSLDKVVKAGESEALADDLNELVARFLNEYPHSVHAPKLVLRQALAASSASAEIVEQLLAVPSNSEVANAARRQAARMLYQLFRSHAGEQRREFANQYLDVAVPLFAQQADLLASADDLDVARFTTRGRRILEVSLLENVKRLVATGNVLEAFDRAVEEQLLDLDFVADEINYRRLRLWLYEGDVLAADALAEQLWATPEQSIWSRLAAQALFRHGVSVWHGGAGSDEHVRTAQNLVLRHGQRVLQEYASDAHALRDASVLSYHATVAEAAFEIWQRSRDVERGDLAIRLYERLLVAQPRNAAFLRAAALLSEEQGTPEYALECWRTLLAGTAEYSEPWYEAKVHQIALLIRLDPARARQVLDQHRLLNPDYGPDPWGERLREMDLDLVVTPDREGAAPP